MKRMKRMKEEVQCQGDPKLEGNRSRAIPPRYRPHVKAGSLKSCASPAVIGLQFLPEATCQGLWMYFRIHTMSVAQMMK